MFLKISLETKFLEKLNFHLETEFPEKYFSDQILNINISNN